MKYRIVEYQDQTFSVDVWKPSGLLRDGAFAWQPLNEQRFTYYPDAVAFLARTQDDTKAMRIKHICYECEDPD